MRWQAPSDLLASTPELLPDHLVQAISEVRLDLEASNQGRLRAGIILTLVTLAVTASGWPPGDSVHRGLFLVLGALPAAAVGVGLILSDLIQARAERRGEMQADDREIMALRRRIAEETGRWHEMAVLPATTPRAPPPAPVHVGSVPPGPVRTGHLVARRGRRSMFRSGALRLRS